MRTLHTNQLNILNSKIREESLKNCFVFNSLLTFFCRTGSSFMFEIESLECFLIGLSDPNCITFEQSFFPSSFLFVLLCLGFCCVKTKSNQFRFKFGQATESLKILCVFEMKGNRNCWNEQYYMGTVDENARRNKKKIPKTTTKYNSLDDVYWQR